MVCGLLRVLCPSYKETAENHVGNHKSPYSAYQSEVKGTNQILCFKTEISIY